MHSCIVYRGLVPMSPKTTPSAPRHSAVFVAALRREPSLGEPGGDMGCAVIVFYKARQGKDAFASFPCHWGRWAQEPAALGSALSVAGSSGFATASMSNHRRNEYRQAYGRVAVDLLAAKRLAPHLPGLPSSRGSSPLGPSQGFALHRGRGPCGCRRMDGSDVQGTLRHETGGYADLRSIGLVFVVIGIDISVFGGLPHGRPWSKAWGVEIKQ